MNTANRMRMMGMAVIAAVALLALFAGTALAADFNKASDVWTNAANWTPNGVPGPQTNCYIGSTTRTIATATINDGDIGFCQNLYLGYVTGGYGELIITNNGVLTFGSTIYPCWNTTGTGVLTVAGGTLRGVTIDDRAGDSTINLRSGLIHLTNTASRLCLGNSPGSGYDTQTARMNISGGNLLVEQTGAFVYVGFYRPGVLTMTGGVVTNNGTLYVATRGASPGAMTVSGGTWVQSNTVNIAAVANATGSLSVVNGGVFSNAAPAGAVNICNQTVAGVDAKVVVSNGTFHSQGNVAAYAGISAGDSLPARIDLDGTQRVFRTGSGATLTLGDRANRWAMATNHVRRVAGGFDIRNTSGTALTINTGSKMHLSFDEKPEAVGTYDFWGLRWAGTNGYARLVTYTNSGLITIANNMAPPFNNQTIGVYTNGGDTYIGFIATVVANVAPVIDQGDVISTNMNEDGGTLDLAGLGLTASDGDGNNCTWTNTTLASNGTVAVSGIGTNPVSWTPLTYTPNTNFNGTNSFVVRASDGLGGNDSITVTVVVAAINDPPTNTVAPGVSSPGFLFSDTWTATNGIWNDGVDTNASYPTPTFTFGYQWQYSNGVSFVNFANETNVTFVPPGASWVGTNVRVRVTCTDSGYPGTASNTADSVWYPVVGAPVPAPVITNIGPLAKTVLEDAASTDLQAVFSLLATNISEAGVLSWSVAVAPTQGTANVSGGTALSSAPSTFTYQPFANRNGSDSFVVSVANAVGGLTSNITVNITITAVNDAPTNTVLPGFTNTAATLLYNIPWTVTNGVWNDNADTNLTYTHAVFTNEAVFTYQWWRSDSAGGPSNLVGTAATYTPSQGEKYKYFNVGVTCTDSNYPTGNNQSTIAWTGWTQEKSVVPPVVTFTNALGDQAWGSYSNWAPQDVPTTNITAVIGSVGVLSPATVELTTGAQAAKNLYLGTNANSKGTLNMTGGTLTFPAAGKIVAAGATSSTGTLSQTGGAVAGITSGDLSIAAGPGGKGTVVLGGSTAITSTWTVASGANSDGTFTLTNNAFWKNGDANPRTVGNAAGAIGRLNVCDGTRMNFESDLPRSLTLGAVAGSTGEVTVIGNGVITNVGTLTVGNPGYGTLTVGGGLVWARQIDIGSTNNNSVVVVKDTGRVVTANDGTGFVRLGALTGASGTLTVTNDGVMSVANYDGNHYSLVAGYADASEGRIDVCGGTLAMTGRKTYLGAGVGSTGILEITSGVFSNAGGAFVFTFGATNNALGELDLRGGKLYSQQDVAFGAAAGAVGRAFVTGGDWQQVGGLNVGMIAGGTGMVTVANCTSATNITGAVTVGGAGYGLLTISNATFGGGTAVTVTNAGIVELTGTGSIFRVNTLAVKNGGAVTNHVRLLPGGVDITNRLNTALSVAGGVIHLAFEGASSGLSGDVWGLRWAGTNGYPVLTNYLATGLITTTNTFTGSYSNQAVTVYKASDNAYTYVGFLANAAPVIDQGATISFGMNEDGGTTNLALGLTLTATDDGTSAYGVTWTNVTTSAHGTVSVNGSGTNPVTWTSFAYTLTNGNWNGTDSFVVQATDVLGASNRITVSVVVAAVNDAPVNTAIPTVSGLFQTGQTVSNDYPGAWNDAADTNVSGSSTLVFTRQWQWATNGVGGGATNFLNETNDTYAVTGVDTGRYVSVRVTCTDDGVGSGSPQSVTTNSVWTLVTVANVLPVITNGNGTLVVSLAEDCGATNLLAVLNLGATDADSGQQDTLVWTNMTGSAYGAMTVSGTGSNPAAITYTPNADWNGTNTFTVRVTDTVGGFDEIGVEVRVAAVNDAPVCTATGTISGPVMVGSNLTVTAGTWNDNIDINVSGSSTLTLSRQWKRNTSATAVGATDIAGATALTYTLTELDRGKYLGVLETCVDTGVGGPGPLTNTVYSGWLQETSPVPGVVVFSNALDTTWGSYPNWKPTIVPTTNITAVIGDTAVLSPASVTLASGTEAAKNLYLGTNANSSGTLNMTGGTLTFPAAGNIVVAGAAGSTGTLNQTGGTISGIESGLLKIADGTNSVGALLLGGNSAITVALSVANSWGADGTLSLSNSAVLVAKDGTLPVIGNASNATGRFYVRGAAVYNGGGRALSIGAVATSTGIVEVTDGVITNVTGVTLGSAGGGYGSMTVSGSGRFYQVGMSYYLDIGGSNSSSILTVSGGGQVYPVRPTRLGTAAGVLGTLTVTNGGVFVCADTADALLIGGVDNAIGRVNVGGGLLRDSSTREWRVGYGIGSTGILTLASGVVSNTGVLTIGHTNNSVGEVYVQGGTLYLSGAATFGANAGAVGRALVTGGDWQQVGALNVGTIAGGTGLVTVANCTSATNITGAVTVGGAGYGLLTISNATFGGGTAVTVTNAGIVELTGTGSIFRVNTLAVKNGGAVTNHVRLLPGGVDVTNSVNTALAVTGGMHLSFEGNSDALPSGNFWGLRWAGTNGYPVLTNFVATGAITVTNQMTGVFSNQAMTVFKAGDNSYTYIGFMNATAPVIDQGDAISTNMNEDGIVYLTNLLWAADADGVSWAWTNTTTPANGTVAVNGSGTNPVNWSAFTYTPNANFNGTNTFQVRVMDDTTLSDSITVTVVVAAVNDAPTNTTPPGISGSGQYGTPWTATNGVWNDNLDTNAGYTHAMFTTTAGFAYQWQYSNDVNIAADATNAAFVPSAEMAGTNIRVRVTCTDGGQGTPGPQSATGYSAYVTVTVPVNDPPTNTTIPGITGNSAYGSVWTATNGVWNDNSDTNVHYTHDNFTNTAVFTYQWQYSNATPDNILNETNATFSTTAPMLGTNIRVKVTCADAGYGTPASTSTVAYSAYRLVTAPSLLVFNETSGDWTNSAHWLPVSVPSAGTPAVIGDLGVKSPATAAIGAADTATVKDLYLGTNANSSGTLNMTGGTLTFPAAGKMVVAGATSSTGTLSQTGGAVAGITSGDLSIAAGPGGKGTVVLGGSTAITSTWTVASGANADGTFTLTNSAFWKNGDHNPRTVGNAAGAIGRLNVCDAALMSFDSGGPRSLTMGAVAGSTGEVMVIGNGVITNVVLTVGNPGYGILTVGGGVVWPRQIDLGGTNNNSRIIVKGTGRVVTLYEGNGSVRIGAVAGALGTLTVTNGGVMSVANYDGNAYSLIAGYADASAGRIDVCGGLLEMTGRKTYLGAGVGSTGILEITSGVFSNAGVPYVFTFGATNNAVGELDLRGGTLYSLQDVAFGAAAGAVGRAFVTGGAWQQVGALGIGAAAGGTGLVTVANCTSATNISGAMTVGGAGYGLLTISNATFGGSTAVTVTNGGNVEVTGAGSMFVVNTLAVKNGGTVTSHVQGVSGGVDVTNSLNSALVVTNGGGIHLVVDQYAAEGLIWGLRWAGNGHAGQLRDLTNAPALLTWSPASANGFVRIYTNSTHTMVGFMSPSEGSVFRFR